MSTRPPRPIRDPATLRLHDEVHTGEIAQALGLTLPYVTNVLTKRADFPKPCTNVSRVTRRWRWGDVVKFKQGQKR